MKAEVRIAPIFDDDSGSLHLRVEVKGHDFSRRERWENCGEILELFECSCGFVAVRAPGLGCWQQDHNVERHDALDATHAALLLLGAAEAVRSDAGCPAQRESLKRTALEELGYVDTDIAETLLFLRKRAGAPTASELRKRLAGRAR